MYDIALSGSGMLRYAQLVGRSAPERHDARPKAAREIALAARSRSRHARGDVR